MSAKVFVEKQINGLWMFYLESDEYLGNIDFIFNEKEHLYEIECWFVGVEAWEMITETKTRRNPINLTKTYILSLVSKYCETHELDMPNNVEIEGLYD